MRCNALQVKVRSEAREIGSRAISKTASERTGEQAAMAQRAALAGMLSGKSPDLNTAVESLIAQQVSQCASACNCWNSLEYRYCICIST